MTVVWSAAPGKTYRVQFKRRVDTPGWTDLPGDVAPDGQTGLKLDDSRGESPQRIYRVLVLP